MHTPKYRKTPLKYRQEIEANGSAEPSFSCWMCGNPSDAGYVTVDGETLCQVCASFYEARDEDHNLAEDFGNNPWLLYLAKRRSSYCSHGHPKAGNTYVAPDGHMQCLECGRTRGRARWAAERATHATT